jgi:hypothetical protein
MRACAGSRFWGKGRGRPAALSGVPRRSAAFGTMHCRAVALGGALACVLGERLRGCGRARSQSTLGPPARPSERPLVARERPRPWLTGAAPGPLPRARIAALLRRAEPSGRPRPRSRRPLLPTPRRGRRDHKGFASGPAAVRQPALLPGRPQPDSARAAPVGAAAIARPAARRAGRRARRRRRRRRRRRAAGQRCGGVAARRRRRQPGAGARRAIERLAIRAPPSRPCDAEQRSSLFPTWLQQNHFPCAPHTAAAAATGEPTFALAGRPRAGQPRSRGPAGLPEAGPWLAGRWLAAQLLGPPAPENPPDRDPMPQQRCQSSRMGAGIWVFSKGSLVATSRPPALGSRRPRAHCCATGRRGGPRPAGAGGGAASYGRPPRPPPCGTWLVRRPRRQLGGS